MMARIHDLMKAKAGQRNGPLSHIPKTYLCIWDSEYAYPSQFTFPDQVRMFPLTWKLMKQRFIDIHQLCLLITGLTLPTLHWVWRWGCFHIIKDNESVPVVNADPVHHWYCYGLALTYPLMAMYWRLSHQPLALLGSGGTFSRWGLVKGS